MKMLVVCPYPEGVAPSQRLKYEQYFPAFRAEGFSIDVRPFMSMALWRLLPRRGAFVSKAFHTAVGYVKRLLLGFRLRRYDVVYIHLWVVPFGPPLFERAYARLARRMIYDVDDLVHTKPTSVNSPSVSRFKDPRRVEVLIERADHVVTCTPYLNSYVQTRNHRSTDISSTVDADVYTPRAVYPPRSSLTLGWSGSFSTARYLHLLDEVFKRFANAADFSVLVIGATGIHIEGVRVTCIPWRRETEVADLQKIDIGLYPLPDEEWVLGKSGLKAIQYMAVGAPVIATDAGATSRVVEDGESGFLVRTDAEWYEALVRLMDRDLRERMGRRGRQIVEERFSVAANTATYVGVLRAVAADKR